MREIKSGKLSPMTSDEFSSAVLRLRDDARNWIDSDVRPARERAWRYYNGAVDKAPAKNRSAAVLTEVRDAVESVIVSLLRIFLSTSSPVEFIPTGSEDVELAKQQTQAATHVFYTQNPGFAVLSDVFRDALIAKTGAMRVWWDNSTRIEETTYEGLTDEEFSELAAQENTEVLEFEPDQDLSDQTLEPTMTVRIRRTHDKGQVRIAAIPPEEVIFNRSATSRDDATIFGQDGLRKAQDIVNEGLATWKEIEGHFSAQSQQMTDEASARSGISNVRPEEETDIGDREVRVSELYIRLDKDGDGIPELRRVILLGDGEDSGKLISDEIWDEIPIFIGSPFPLPHNIIGMGIADLTCDLQDVSTSVQRAMLDSLWAAVNPRYTAGQGQVNLPDLGRDRFNDIIKVRVQGAVQPLVIPFQGRDALAVLEYMDTRKEARTGVSRASLGLDADALQSSTAIGVNATITAAQAKTESIARSLAEQIVVPAFREINRLLTHYQDKELMVRLRGKFIAISTDGFVVDMDVTTNVGLGRGTEDEKLAVLSQIMLKQEEILKTIGPDNPLVTLQQYSHTLSDMVELSPVKDPTRYFNPPEVVAQLAEQHKQQQANQDPPPDPVAQAKVAVMQAKIQLDQQQAQADQELAKQKAKADLELDTFKVRTQLELKRQELLAEIQLEKIKVETNPDGPGVGNIPSPE